MSDLEPIKLDFTVNNSVVFEEFAKMVKAAQEQTKSVDNAQSKFKEYINTQLSASGALSKNAELTDAQTKALQRHAETIDYLKGQVANTFDPTQLGVYNYQLQQAQQAINSILESANNKAALIDTAEMEKANQKLQEAERLLDQISDKTFTPSFASPEELEVLSTEINTANDELEQLGIVIDFISAKMGTMDSGSQAFKDLEKDIATANQMLGRLPQSYDTAGNSIDQMTDVLKEFQNQLNAETDPEKIKILNQNIENLENSIKKLKNAGKEGFDDFGNKLEENREKAVSLQTELENLVQSMARLRMAGKQKSDEYEALKSRAIEARAAIASTNQEINASASSTSGLDTLIRATSAVASGYSLAQSTAALFGAENEEVEQSIMKITAAMSALQSLQQIQAELKKSDSLATIAQTKAQGLYTAVVGSSTGALKIFRIALASTGIGLIIILLASLVANWDKVTASIKKSFPALNSFGDKLDNMKAYVMGFLNAFLSLSKTVLDTLLKIKNVGFKGALNNLKNAKSEAEKAFENGKQNSLNASAQDKKNAQLEKSLEIYDKETERLEHLTGKKQYDRREKSIKAQLRLVDKGSKEEAELIHKKNLLLADKEKERNDEAKKQADKRQKEAEKAAKKAEQLARQEAEDRKAAKASIAQAEREYQKSRMIATDKEIADIQDKYAKLRAEAQKAKLGAMDMMRIDNLEKAETKSVTEKHANEQFFKELEEQKELFAAYEVFKTKVGKEEADKRYQNELLAFENYGALLDAEIEKIKALGDALTPEQFQKLEKLQSEKKSYDKDKNKEAEQKYAEAYNSLLSFDDKRRAIDKKYQQDKVLLTQITDEKVRQAKLAELEFQKKAALDAVNTEAYDRETIMQRLSENLMGITRRELNNRIASLEEYLEKAGDHLDETQKEFVQNELKKAKAVRATTDVGVEEKVLLQEKEAILKRITDLQSKGITNVSDELKQLEEVNMKLKDILAKKFAKVSEVAGQLGGAFSELGGALKEYDEGLGDTVESMGELLNVASDVAGALADFASGPQGIVGGIMKTIKAITSIFSIGAKARESERKAQEQIKKYHDEIFQSQLNYNSELRKRVAEEVKLNDLYKSRVTNIREELEANRKNAESIKKDQEAVFKRLLNARTVTGMHTEKYGGFLGIGRKTRAVEETSSVAKLLGIGKWVEKEIAKIAGWSLKIRVFEPGEVELTDKIFEDLEKLNAEKPLTGDAKTAYEQLKKLREEYGSIENARRELDKQLREAITGTTADSIADSIKQGIASGKKSFADFADDIEGFLRNAVLAGLETDVFRKKTQELHEVMEEMLQDGVITSEERERFNQLYMAIVEESKQKVDMLNQAGINVIQQQERLNSLQGAIKGASQESIDILSGHFAGVRLHVIEIVKMMKSNGTSGLEKLSKLIEIQMNIERNTRKTAENTEKLHDIDEGISKVEKAIKGNGNDAKGLGF
ncbi:hypothetical protein OKE63_01250 [Riemerella anatipestifer]|uniref:hypothetical protein n=1 Tax=Riemerella anatipestifer TaxID=34085 RepID=UPI0021F87813|nr:hypothetical protein [Riemerella anatipestifer]MCW0497793.1 hypothetical protein [Riemerella anatipestifer]